MQEALTWYEKAAAQDYPRAQYLVGYKYYYGWGYEKDYDKARLWFEKSAEQNYPAALNHLGNMYADGIGVSQNYDEAIKLHRKAERYRVDTETAFADSVSYVLNGIIYEGDKTISGLLPPKFIHEITEGSCGEACIWSLVNSKSFVASQIEINKNGGDPGRGLHGNELYRSLDSYNIEFIDNIRKSYFKYVISFFNPANIFLSNEKEYRDYLYDVIIEKIKQGIPIILGIKIYPDEHFFWDTDHFILLVGYNEQTNEIIYNDFNKRKRINAEKLLDKIDGYSLINRYNFLNYIEITDY